MKIYIVSNGLYEDKTVIGVATSTEMADMMVMQAKLSGEFDSLDYRVQGPFEPNAVYNWRGVKVA